MSSVCFFFFFFNDTATTEIYTLSLHDALPICTVRHPRRFKIVVIDIQITLKQMLRDFIGIRVNRAKKIPKHLFQGYLNRSEERFSRNAETDLVCRLLLETKKMSWMSSSFFIRSMNSN